MRTLRTINDVWVYDNPDTGMREVFKHGHLLIHFPEVAFAKWPDPNHPKDSTRGEYLWWPSGENRWVQEMYLDDMRSLGPFDEGAEYGDRIHRPYDPLATELWSRDNGN